MSEKSDRALWWIENGFALLPCQPGQKNLVQGFGQYRSKITDADQVRQWWHKPSAPNLAVIAPEGFYILDFDKISVYAAWSGICPEGAQSYTETTPSGGRHVFLRGTIPAGLCLVDGAEIKRVVVVCPSVVDGKDYTITKDQPFADPDPLAILSPLSKPGHATPYAMQANITRRAAINPFSHIDQIKSHFSISHVLKLYRPDIKIIGRGDWLNCPCPFHDDKKPSFYFSDQKGVWGCHACNVRGDVINLYARFEAVNVREAVSRMWAVMA